MSNELNRADTYRDMDYRWTKLGLSIEDMPIFGIPLAIMFFVAIFVDVPFTLLFFAEGVMALFLILIKWRKPPDHLENLLILYTGQRRLSHKERDPHAGRVFPLDDAMRPRQTSETQ